MRETLKQLLNVPTLRRLLSVAVLILIDAGSLVVGVYGTGYLVGGVERGRGGTDSSAASGGGWVVILAAHELYDRARTRRDPGALLGAVLSWAGLVVLGSMVYPESGLGVGEVLLAALFALVFVSGLRFLYEQGIEWIYRRGMGRTTAVVIGNTEERGRVTPYFWRVAPAHTRVWPRWTWETRQ